MDDTSKCQSFLDEEYARIKNNILDYTSRSLDTAYSRYKENMEWAKYEAEEKKGENFVADLNRLLAEEERGLNAFLSKPVIALSKLKDKMQAL